MSSIVLPEPIPDCGLMTTEVESEPLDIKLPLVREMGLDG
jgi:hypothetical protein